MIGSIGIIGAGGVAIDHAKAALRLGARVVAAGTRSSGSPRWQAFQAAIGPVPFASADDILAAPEVQAVVVCASWWAMPDLLPGLLRQPKPVLLDKPIGIDRRAMADALAQAGAEAGNKLVGFNRRFYAPVARLRRRLAEGGLISAEISVSENLDALVRRWGRDILPHVLSYSSCHILDLARHLLGELRVERAFRHPVPGFAPFANVTALLTSPEGKPVALSVVASDPVVVGIRCRFDDGSIWHLGPIERLVVYRGYRIVEPDAACAVRRYDPNPVEETLADSGFRPGFLEQMSAFLTGSHGPGATPAEAVALQTMIEELQS